MANDAQSKCVSWRQCKLKKQYFHITTLRPGTTTPRGQAHGRLMTSATVSVLYLGNSLVFRHFIPPTVPDVRFTDEGQCPAGERICSSVQSLTMTCLQ